MSFKCNLKKFWLTALPLKSYLAERLFYTFSSTLWKGQGTKINGVGSEACLGVGELLIALWARATPRP
jgi:hypothetical protein